MALSSMRLGRNKEKRGAARRMVIRHRRQGTPVNETRPSVLDSDQQVVEVEYNDAGALVTDPDVLPRP